MKLVWFLMVVFLQKSLQDGKNMIPVVVSRRLFGDIQYFDYPDEFNACSDINSSNVTYLVEERQCVTSDDLLKECSSVLITTESTKLIAIALSTSSSITTVEVNHDTDAIFHFQDMKKPLNNSVCNIASLEVYRGMKQAIKISHDGFSLTENSTIKINYNETTYNRDEYEGELYRMYLSCFGEGLPESGCLFFKIHGIANITNAKFKCTVPGTQTDFNEECNYTPATDTISATTSPITTLTKTTIASRSLSPTSGFEAGGTYFLIVVICGVLVVTLLVVIVLMCFMVCLLRRKIRPSSVQTAPLGEGSCKQESSLQDLDAKLDNRYHAPMAQDYETVISNGGMTGGENHIYAALETPKNPRHYTDPIKINPNKMKEHPNSSLQTECHELVSAPGAQYENPNNTSNKPQLLAEGLSDDVSEHKYAELERQPPTQLQGQPLPQGGEVHHYDAPPREDENSLRPHSSDKQYGDDLANHEYAVLEKI